MVDQLYQKNIGFKKCGVILTCLEPKATHIYDLFTDMNKIESSNKLMDSLDDIQNKFGKRKIGLGAICYLIEIGICHVISCLPITLNGINL